MDIEQKFREQLGPNYDHSAKPTVYFFDHAMPVKSDGRPRFKNAVYISKKSKTSHSNQDFQRKMQDTDKQEFPAEWEHYLKIKDNLKQPRISLLPGIDHATLAEMKALDIHNLPQLLAQEHFDEWQQLARRLLDAANNSNGNQERESVQGDKEQQPERVLGTDWTHYFNPGQERGQEKGYPQEITEQENGFSFSITG